MNCHFVCSGRRIHQCNLRPDGITAIDQKKKLVISNNERSMVFNKSTQQGKHKAGEFNRWWGRQMKIAKYQDSTPWQSWWRLGLMRCEKAHTGNINHVLRI